MRKSICGVGLVVYEFMARTALHPIGYVLMYILEEIIARAHFLDGKVDHHDTVSIQQ